MEAGEGEGTGDEEAGGGGGRGGGLVWVEGTAVVFWGAETVARGGLAGRCGNGMGRGSLSAWRREKRGGCSSGWHVPTGWQLCRPSPATLDGVE